MKISERVADLFIDHNPNDKSERAQKPGNNHLFNHTNVFLNQLGIFQSYFYSYVGHYFQTEEEHKEPYCLVCKYPEFYDLNEILWFEFDELICNCDYISYLLSFLKHD